MIFSMYSTWKWPQKNSVKGGGVSTYQILPMFMKIKRRCSIRTEDVWVGRPKQHLLPHRKGQQTLAIQIVSQCAKIAMLWLIVIQSRSHGVSRILNKMKHIQNQAQRNVMIIRFVESFWIYIAIFRHMCFVSICSTLRSFSQ